MAGPVAERPAAPAGVRPYLLLAALIAVGGTNWGVLKTVLAQVSPLGFAALSVAAACAAMFALAGLAGALALPGRADLVPVAAVGLLQIAAYTLLIFFGLRLVEAGRSAILASTMPIWVAPGAALFLGERLGRRMVAALGLAALGLAVLFLPTAVDWGDGRVVLGNGLLLLAAIAWAATILALRGHRWRRSPLALAPWQLALATAAIAPLAFGLEGWDNFAWSPTVLAALAWNALAGTAFAVWATVEVARALPAVTTSMGLLGIPVAATLTGAAVLDEPLTASIILGLGLILVGNVCLALAGRGRRGCAGAAIVKVERHFTK